MLYEVITLLSNSAVPGTIAATCQSMPSARTNSRECMSRITSYNVCYTKLLRFLLDMDMKPVYIVSGTPGKKMHQKLEALLSTKVPEAKFKNGEGADMFLMHQWIKNESVDLLIGNTYGKYIARDENIPFVRMGFPIIDRIGHSYFPTVGYMGGIRIVRNNFV